MGHWIDSMFYCPFVLCTIRVMDFFLFYISSRFENKRGADKKESRPGEAIKRKPQFNFYSP